MNDELRRLWEELPVRKAPIEQILAEGRREPRGRSRRLPTMLRRGLVTATALGTVAAAFLIGSQAGPEGPGPGGGSAAEPGGVAPVAFHGELKAAASCSALGAYYVEQGLERVGPYGWENYGPWVQMSGRQGYLGDLGAAAWNEVGLNGAFDQSGSLNRSLRAPMKATTTRAESSDTGTNAQEQGVDEPDVAKTDGSVLVTLADDVLTTYDVTGAAPRRLATLPLRGFHRGELLLSGTTAVAIGEGARSFRTAVGAQTTGRRTEVVSIDLGDPRAPRVTHTSSYDASLLSVRQHGSSVRLVLSAGLPELDFREPRGKTGRRTARQHNQRLVRTSAPSAWLPQVSDDRGADAPAVACTDVAIPQDGLGLDTVAVVGFEADTPQQRHSIAVASEARSVYEAEDRLFLAADAGPVDCCWDSVGPAGRDEGAGRTHLFDFALEGTAARYLGSGTVAGTVRDRWSMDWADGTLRVAVGPSVATRNQNAIVTLAERDGTLVEVGRIGRLGINEQIKAVRWFDDLALVVTFRERDPLYAVDLTDPRRPRLLGALKIPGFSEYLHPLGSKRLIGVGSGPGEKRRWGAQTALFNVGDLTRPRQLDVVHYPAGSRAGAGTDPRQFTWLPQSRTAVTVIERGWNGRRGFVTLLQPREGRFQHRELPLRTGTLVSQVRALPLPDGRALLVAGDEVTFLDLEQTE